MRIELIDVDSHGYPNLPLMKISAYHKAQGDEVEWYCAFDQRYDVVYMSKVFSFSPDYMDAINADKVIKGGSGYAIRLEDGKEIYDKSKDASLPSEVEHIYPDYSIYNIEDTAYGFLTRGCPRGCDFCHVKDKEGRKTYKVADLDEFWHGQKNIVLCDPNILACKDWKNLLQQLADSKAYVDFNQGLDARLLTEDKCIALSKIKIKEIHFAWDKYNDKERILKGLEMFAKYSRKPHSHIAVVYVLVNFDTTIEQDLERIYTLRDLGYWAYVMIYDKAHCKPIYKDLQRWCNNRLVFAKCKNFNDYKKNYQYGKNGNVDVRRC